MTHLLEDRLLRRKECGNLRQLEIRRNLIDFASNDYLGLARSPKLLQRWESQLSMGSTGSRLITGNSSYVQDLEQRIAAFHGYDAGLVFNCGYMANVGLLSTIGDCKSTLFFDAHVHASTYDGIRLGRCQAYPFRHNDLEHLEQRLKDSSSQGDRFICIESIYSTDGSKSPLAEICQLAREYDAHVIVDEAHAVGACGPGGRGLVSEQNLTSQCFAQVTTFGKALGAHGAIVLGGETLKQALINFATPYIYTTALPFYSLAAIQSSYDIFPTLEQERRHLHKLIQIFREAYPHSSETHIQTIAIQGNEAARRAAQKLAQAGFDVRPLMSPTVQRGKEVLRICLHAFNTENDVKRLLEYIEVIG